MNLDIATAPQVSKSPFWKRSTVTWDELVTKVKTPADRKDCGGYFLGRLRGTERKKGHVESRSAITLDADSAEPTLPDMVEVMLGCRALVHTTWQSTPGAPRYRIIIALSRPVTPDEYGRIVRALVRLLGRDQFDITCEQPERCMYWPASPDQSHYAYRVIEGEPLDPDDYLSDDEPPAQQDGTVRSHDGPARPVSTAYVRAAVKGVLKALDVMAGLPEKARDERGDGWDDGVFRCACQLVRAANSGTDYTLDDAEADFMKHAPPAVDRYSPQHKWSDAVTTVAGAGLELKGSSADDDFAGGDGGGRTSVATELIGLALGRYNLGRTPSGEPYAVPKSGPRLVRALRGGTGSLRAELAAAYYANTGKGASSAALADALVTIEGQAINAGRVEELHLRIAKHGSDLWLDLGDDTGRAVRLRLDGWLVTDEVPVLFRRTALCGALPDPVGGGGLDDLWQVLNVRDADRPLLLAVLVSALLPDIPHPILALLGEQGTGKSTATRAVAGLVDPSPVQLRKAPRDAEAWVTAAAGSWVVALDNLSGLKDWLSDSLCRAVTGEGDVRRRLYTDGDLHVVAYRRVVILNGIDLGALRDDLAERLVTVNLKRIPENRRAREADLTAAWEAAHPRALGALLDLACKVLAVLPQVHLAEAPRMADFAYVLAAVDQVLGTAGLDTYRNRAGELAADAVTSDPVLARITERITEPFRGTSADLLAQLAWPDGPPPRGWPTSPRALTEVLRRRAPSLRQVGWTVEDEGRAGKAQSVVFSLVPPEPEVNE